MPWHVKKDSGRCPASKPYAVLKDSDGSLVGCHASEQKAKKQIAALNANVEESMSQNGDLPRDNLFRAVHPGIEVRSDPEGDGKPVLFGHFARFNEWTEINSLFEGNFMERFAPGSFKKTLREQRPKILLQHGHDPELGDKPIASLREAKEDDDGAFYEADLFDGLPGLVMDGLRAGEYGASFRFRVLREDIDNEPEASDHNPNGLPERTVREAEVKEFGPVTFPAYEGATAQVRSLTDRFLKTDDLLRALLDDPEQRQHVLAYVEAITNRSDTPDDDPAPAEETDAGQTSTSVKARRGKQEQGRKLVLPSRPKQRRRGVLPD